MSAFAAIAPGGMFHGAKTPSIFDVRSSHARPMSHVSDATEIFDTDIEDESYYNSSFKGSFESDDRRRSQTTISSYDEAQTPSPREGERPQFEMRCRATEGPKGPHLFRASTSTDLDFDYYLQMSPVLTKAPPPRAATAFTETTINDVRRSDRDVSVPSRGAGVRDAEAHIRGWSTERVIDWMYQSGIDSGVIDCFDQHDINGDVLLDLEFEHLKELDIPSFGKRHQLWNAICLLRGDDQPSPQPTPFQDISRPMTTVPDHPRSHWPAASPDRARSATPGGKKRRGRKAPKHNDIVTPAESVSIVAIEQLVPKLHQCSKGENCAKWRKQQRQLEQMRGDVGIGAYPISPEKGGHIILVGDPGNAATASNLVPTFHKFGGVDAEEASPEQEVLDFDVFRPTSEAIPSIVASSDLLGPGEFPEFALNEGALDKVGVRNPQDRVQQYLQFQHMNSPLPPNMIEPVARPVSPEFEMFPSKTIVPFPARNRSMTPPSPPTHAQRANLQSLPRLEIPRAQSAGPQSACSVMSPEAASCRTAVKSPMIYRLGTPASEMDVPVTAVPITPVSRDASQSVPPDMRFHQQRPLSRSLSRSVVPDWRRPSMQLPVVQEGHVFAPEDGNNMNPKASASHRPSVLDPAKDEPQTHVFRYGEDCSHAGWMRKRRTKMLRHEWQDAHFRLKGTQLAMHANARLGSAALDTIDVDKYAVACSSVASSSKLSAAMKAFSLKTSSEAKAKADATAFAFQLVPSRDACKTPTGPNGQPAPKRLEKANGKTHHFAVTSKDERIDWMRELMLAKALQQKGKGYEVEVNGVPQV